MKVAVSASGTDLDAAIDPRFGRCAYFLVVDTEDMSFESFSNENNALGGGAGIQSAQFVASKGARVVLTGNCGPNAVRTLAAAGVEVIVGQTGTVREAVERYRAGDLTPTTEANVADHYGMGGGTGGGMGRGMGGGMGYKKAGTGPVPPAPGAPGKRDDLKALKEQAEALRKQMEAIEARIREME
ncbi:MAG: dinitrogenase iron-molybdenum cofactor biosynthesis protein [Deltaproteobacteria bacterium]|nr:MAG: dinitrogenase iron-molybdenum cofactor biosynthesis protein [Deltaproteobacteria bacterium]